MDIAINGIPAMFTAEGYIRPANGLPIIPNCMTALNVSSVTTATPLRLCKNDGNTDVPVGLSQENRLSCVFYYGDHNIEVIFFTDSGVDFLRRDGMKNKIILTAPNILLTVPHHGSNDDAHRNAYINYPTNSSVLNYVAYAPDSAKNITVWRSDSLYTPGRHARPGRYMRELPRTRIFKSDVHGQPHKCFLTVACSSCNECDLNRDWSPRKEMCLGGTVNPCPKRNAIIAGSLSDQ